MNYKEALELNESKSGLDFGEIETADLLTIIDEVPGWDYPLAEELMSELAKRAGIDKDVFFVESDRDYSDLWVSCTEALEMGK